MMKLRKQVIDLAVEIALEESKTSNRRYSECVSIALDKACSILKVNRKQFIRMFI